MLNVAEKFKQKLAEVVVDYPELSHREQIETARNWTIQACHDEIGNAISDATDDLGGFYAPHLTRRQTLNLISPEIQGQTIFVWSWVDAPLALKKHVSHGGDEDWVALVPKDYGTILWMDSYNTAWGDTREFILPDGRKVVSGAHA